MLCARVRTIFGLNDRDACAPPSAAGHIGSSLSITSSEEVLPSGKTARQTPRPAAGRPRAKTRRRESNIPPPTAPVVPLTILHVDRPRIAAPAPALHPGESTTSTHLRPQRTPGAEAAPGAEEAPRYRSRGRGDAPAESRGLVAARRRAKVSVLPRVGVYRCACG